MVCRSKESGVQWVFSGVCGPSKNDKKQEFWEELDSLGRYWELPWMLAGDFNAVKSRRERSSNKASISGRENFLEFCDEHCLLEFDRTGPLFTYSNKQEVPTFSRLDRYLANIAWMEVFSEHKEKTLGFYGLDHIMVLLEDRIKIQGSRPFRFQQYWWNNDDLLP